MYCILVQGTQKRWLLNKDDPLIEVTTQACLTMFHLSFIIKVLRLDANSVNPDEMAHYEPPHLNLHCLQIHTVYIFGNVSVRYV